MIFSLHLQISLSFNKIKCSETILGHLLILLSHEHCYNIKPKVLSWENTFGCGNAILMLSAATTNATADIIIILLF
jgi:hypothetical protein